MTAEYSPANELTLEEAKRSAGNLLEELKIQLAKNSTFGRKLTEKFLDDPASLIMDNSLHLNFRVGEHDYELNIWRPAYEDRISLQRTRHDKDGIHVEGIRLDATRFNIIDDPEPKIIHYFSTKNSKDAKSVRLSNSQEAISKVKEFIQSI